MKKLFTLCVLSLILLFTASDINAQTPQFFNRNISTSSNNWPLNAASTINNRCQWKYGPNAFSSLGGGLGVPAYSGLITHIYFRTGFNVNATSVYNITMALGQNAGTTPTFANGTYITGLTNVFTSATYSLTGVTANSWYQVTLPTPFLYNPSLSLVFDMYQTGTGGGNLLSQNNIFGTRIYGGQAATGGTLGSGLVDFGFDLIPNISCTAAPNAGTTTGPTNPCPGVNATYYLTGSTLAAGLSYQWLQSATSCAGPWNLMVNDTLSSMVTQPPVGVTTYYRCVVTCDSLSLSDTSTCLAVTPQTWNPFSPCYCGNSSATSTALEDIGQFNIGTLSNPTVAPTPQAGNPSATGTYSNYDTLTPIPTFIQGQSYPISALQISSSTFMANSHVKAWIDYDHNTVFDVAPSNDEIFSQQSNAGNGFNPSGTFTVPTTALPGLTRLRVVLNRTTNAANVQPCGTYTFGETEDYVVNILAAGPHDPAVTNIQVQPSAGCMDSNGTVIVTVSNFGSQNLDPNVDSFAVTLNVNGPSGLTTYTKNYSPTYFNTTLAPFNTSSGFIVFNNVNLYEGGCYTINTDTITMFSSANTNLVNDSLLTAVTVCNSRPNNGGDYTICLGDTIPTGQGLSIINCPTGLTQDSVIIPFTISFTGNIPPNPTTNASVGSSQFASGTLPNLPPGVNILSGELSVTNLTLAPPSFTTNPSLTRFSLFQGATPPPTANIYHNGAVGSTAPGPNFDYLSFPAGTPDLNSMYNNALGTPVNPAINMGHWNTNRPTSPNVWINAGGTTTVYLKLVYEYVPMGISWYEQPTGGVRISDSSVLDPLTTTNSIVNTSSPVGTYTFYGACAADTNCRVASTLIIQGLDIDSVSFTNVLCNGDSTATAYIQGSGGSTGLYYTIDGPIIDTNLTGVFTGLPVGVYTLNVHDSVGCSSSDSMITITSPPPLVIDSIVSTIPTCTPGCDATQTVYASGGIGNYQYSNGGANQPSNAFTNECSGNYVITVTDANGCTVQMNDTILTPTNPSFTSVASTDPQCFGDTTGTITVTAQGGSSGIASYSSAPGLTQLTAGNFSGVGAGPYVITATDSNNCSVDTNVTITSPGPLSFVNVDIDSTSCNGVCDGQITVGASGGVPGYDYRITAPITVGPNTTGVFSNLCANTYTVRITDTNGCTHDTMLTVAEPAVLVIDTASVTHVACNGDSTGSIVMTHTGGTGGVTYVPNPLTNLAAGTYTITGTDANGCTATTSVTINEPTPLQLTNVSSTTPSCVPGCDATATITATGGTTAYQYQFGVAPAQASPSFPNQCAGTYVATVIDANGCMDTMSHTISVPGSPTWGTITRDSVDCNGGSDGSFTVNVIVGGAGIDSIQLIATTTTVVPGPLSQNSTTATLGSLPAGTYTVRAVDANGCAIVTNIVIDEPTPLVIDSVVVDSVDCFGASTGSFTVYASGGTPTYSFNNGATTSNTGVFTGLAQGPYTVTVTDANGCTLTTNVTVNEPLALSYTNVSVTNVTCFGDNDGEIQATATGGTGTLNISLIPGPGGPSPSPATFTGLSGGAQTVRVIDDNGCMLDSNVTVIEPNVLVIDTASVTQVLCQGDSSGVVVMTRTGGTGPMTYTYTPLTTGVSVVDSTISNLPAGTYTITGTDGNGCTATYSITITEPSSRVDITAITGTTPSCIPGNDGTITVTANGGTGVLEYGLMPIPPNTYQPGNTFTGLGSGTYTVRVRDANGCTADTSYTIANSNAPTIDSVLATMTQCNGDSTGSIYISGTGNPPASITYAITASTPGITTTPILGTPDTTFNNLPAGTYTVTVNDANNCPVSTAVLVTEPTAVSFASITTDSVNCNGGNDGSITLTASGGTSPYTVSAPGAGNPLSPNFIYNNLSAGGTNVIITDNNGCTADSLIQIYEPTPVSIDSLSSMDVLCNGDSTGSIYVSSSGGTGPINHMIGSTTVNTNPALFTSYAAGPYTVTATDAYGCTATQSVTVNEPTPLAASFTSSDVSCFGGNDGQIVVIGNGGVGPYDYALIPPYPLFSPLDTFNLLTAGNNYVGIVRDSNGCVDSTVQITITEPTQITFTSVTKQDVECFGQSTGSISASASGGTGTIMIGIPGETPQASPANFTNLPAGNYVITATDANNCTVTTSITIIENPPIFFSSITNTEERCFGDGDASITFQAAGGVGPYGYQFNNGNPPGTAGYTSQTTYTGLATGTYPIAVEDALGCLYDTTYTLSGPDRINWPVFDITPTTCLDTEDGKLSVEAAGGRGSDYTYSLEPGFYVNTDGRFRDLEAREYTLRTTDSAGCFIDTVITIPLPSNPMVVTITKEDLGCHGRGNEGTAEAIVTGGTPPYTYLWSSTPVQTTSRVKGLYQGLHTVDVVDGNGCLERDTLVIEPGPCCEEVFLPNAFSPNGDGMNDEFRILSTAGMKLDQFEVYNRWGIRIWQTTNVRSSWDGTYDGEPVNAGTFYYVLRYKCLTDGQSYTKKGDVVVVR